MKSGFIFLSSCKNLVAISLLVSLFYSNLVHSQTKQLDENDYQMAVINLMMKKSYYSFDSSFKNLRHSNSFTAYLNSQYYYTFLIFSNDSTVDISNYSIQSGTSINSNFDKGDNKKLRIVHFSPPESSGEYSFTVVARSKDPRPVSIMIFRSTYIRELKNDFDIFQLKISDLLSSIIEVNMINEGFSSVISTKGMKKKSGDNFSLKLDRRNEYRLFVHHSLMLNSDYDNFFQPQLSSWNKALELKEYTFGNINRVNYYHIIPLKSKTYEFLFETKMDQIIDSLTQFISHIDDESVNLTMSKDSMEAVSISVSAIKKLDYTLHLYGKEKEFSKIGYLGYTTLLDRVGFGAFIGFVSVFDPIYGAYLGFYATSGPEYENVTDGVLTGNVRSATEVKFTFGPTMSYKWGVVYAGLGVGLLNEISEYTYDPKKVAYLKWDKNRWGNEDKYGLVLESGLVFNLGKSFYAGLACSTTNFLTLEPSLNFGYRFTMNSNK